MGEDQPRGDIPPDEPRDTRRLTVRETAEELGISEAAVRNRISRGTLRVVRKGGAVYVLLGGDESSVNRGESHDLSGDSPSDESRLIEALQDQVQYLRGELEAERESRRRADHIIAALTERIPELEAPPQSAQEAESVAESAAEGESGEEAAEVRTESRSAGEQGYRTMGALGTAVRWIRRRWR